MITLTLNSLGLVIAGAIIFLGLAIPMGIEQDEMGWGFLYAIIMCICAFIAYSMVVGMTHMFGA